MLFCAAASLRQEVADGLIRLANEARDGARIPFVTGLGATESAPMALCAGDAAFTGGRIGVPVPGVELKVAPVGDQMEGRLRGPNITPGYWANPELTREAFDEEGYYKLGDALALLRSAGSVEGICVPGAHLGGFQALDGDVRAGRARFGRGCSRTSAIWSTTSSIAGHDREFVGALVFPNVATCRELAGIPGACSPRQLLDAPECPGTVRGALRLVRGVASGQLHGGRSCDSSRGPPCDRRAGDHGKGQREPEGRSRRDAPRSLRNSTVMPAQAS